jgi:phosphoribosylformylglycinamidine synthase
MKAKVYVTLKKSVLDPQGKAVQHALASMGFPEAKDVRVGKYIELDLATIDRVQAETKVKTMCEKLLANTVIEEYKIELQG